MKKLFCMLAVAAVATSASGQVLMTCDFSPEQMVSRKVMLPQEGRIIQDETGKHVLEIATDVRRNATITAKIPFDFTKYRNQELRISVLMKFEKLTKPHYSWNGTKVMAEYVSAAYGRQWVNGPGLYGDQDWKTVAHSFTVHADAEAGVIHLGIQDCTGKAWFKDFKVEIQDMTDVFPRYTPLDYKIEYSEKVWNDKRRRGVMSPGSFSEKNLTKDLPDLRSWGGNLIRWQLIRNWHGRNDNQDPVEYLQWVTKRANETKRILDKAYELGMKVVVDLHVAPGGRHLDGHMNMFKNELFADTFEKAWVILATTLKGHPALFGFDLINEPSQPKEKVKFDYLGLQFRVAKRVREIDPDTPIIIESNEWDSPNAFRYLSPIPMKNIIYQAHMYMPGQFTHQQIFNKKQEKTQYPDPKRGWTKEMLRNHLAPVRAFQQRHGARIYIGEFSAARWAQGAENYLEDCISIFEEYGWDWSYHAFREAACWSVEHSEDPTDFTPVKEDTKRKKVLLKYFKRNEFDR